MREKILFFLILFFLFNFFNLKSFAVRKKEMKKNQEEIVKLPIEDKLTKAKKELIKREWIVYVDYLNLQKMKIKNTDVLNFSEDKFTSRNLNIKGFLPTNYTLSINEEGIINWEVIQKNDKEELAIWRGELKDDVLSGVLVILKQNSELEEYSFSLVSSEN